MKIFMMLNLVGDDRPGIVDQVSAILLGHDANIEDSRMAALGGCFGIMALFSCDDGKKEAVRTELENMRNNGFAIHLRDAKDPSLLPVEGVYPLGVEIEAMDNPGIVKEVVHILHHHQVNILSLDTQVTPAPYSGVPLFHLSLDAEVRNETTVAAVKADVKKLGVKMGLDLQFITDR